MSARVGGLALSMQLALSIGVGCKGEVASNEAAASAATFDASARGTAQAGSSAAAGAGGRGGTPSAPPMDAGLVPLQGDAGGNVGASASLDAAVASSDASIADASGDGSADAAGTSDAQAALGDPVIVAVGYLGLRLTSHDLGRSWEETGSLPNPDPSGGLDNNALLRAAAYGNGLFVAAGHRIFTSPDGTNWTERDNPQDQWFGGVQWGNNRFVAAGGYGDTWYSDDGITWHAGGKRGSNSHARAVAFGNGEFRASTDDGNWWRSTNGESWSLVSGDHASRIGFCDGEFRDSDDCPPPNGHGVYIQGGPWDDDIISYSEDAEDWHDVHVEYVGSLTGVAFGYD